MAAADRLARFCFPCVVVIAKLMPILKEIMEMPEFGEAAADKTKALKATGVLPYACALVGVRGICVQNTSCAQCFNLCVVVCLRCVRARVVPTRSYQT